MTQYGNVGNAEEKKTTEEMNQYGNVGNTEQKKTTEEMTQYGNVDCAKEKKTTEETTQYGNVDIAKEKKTREDMTQYVVIASLTAPTIFFFFKYSFRYAEVNAAKKEKRSSAEKIDYKDSPSLRKKKSKCRKDRSVDRTSTHTEGYAISPKRKSRSKKEKLCESTQDETPKRRKHSRGAHERSHALDDTPRKRRSRTREGSMERTALCETVLAQTCVENDTRNIRGKLMVAEVRSRRSKRKDASLRKKKTKTYGTTEVSTIPTTTATPESANTTTPGAGPTTSSVLESSKEEKASTRITPSKPLAPATGMEPPKEQTSIRIRLSRALTTATSFSKATTSTTTTTAKAETSIRERLKRGIKSALSAFSRASLEKSFQNAKARMMAPKRTSSLYDYQDSYMGGAMDDDDDEEEDDDVAFYTDMSHRPDLVLVHGNNTNNGQIFNEKGHPFWKDKKFLAEIPRPTRQPLSTLLLMLSERKLALKDPVAAPCHLDGMELELFEMQIRDRKHFSDDLLLSNTIRSIISTLDDIDEYSKNKPVDIHQLKVSEPKTAREYSRHYPENNEEVAFVNSGLGVCKKKKSKCNSASLSTGSISSSSSNTERSSKSKRKKKKKDSKKDSNKTEIKEERSARRRKTKKKDV
ncbi:hypothetical protein Aduo_014560 [Ancylostoma duodenale]